MNDAALVTAAQTGDPHAVDRLLSACLPLVYNIVGRALGDRADVDDVVQETMLRVLRDLPSLRAPESLRAWLATIAVRQVGTHLRRRAAVARTTGLDDATGTADGTDFEDLAILRLGLAGQRRQAVRAGRWLDPDNRALLSLWWLEATGQLRRSELAAAIGVSVAHAGVRVQRMRDQFETSRSVVAALEVNPRCGGLDKVVAHWDGRPNPLWRKRIARHVLSCTGCGRATAGLVGPEKLLLGLALVPVPVPATLAGTITQRASTAPHSAPSGAISLEAANAPGRFVAVSDGLGALIAASAGSPEPVRVGATFEAVPGLADAGCVSFRAPDGRYLRHSSWRLRGDDDDGTELFRGDATFCPRPGPVAGTTSWESHNYPGWFLRHVGDVMWVDMSDGSAAFRDDSAFRVRAPLSTRTGHSGR
jgi:RNA polymerase sigma factor (sigma-70 family)